MILHLPHRFETEQGLVRYGTSGKGPPLVLVHGTPWSSFSYSKIHDRLTRDYTVYSYDLIGYGQSEMRDDQNVSLDIQGQILADLLDYWDLQDPFIVAHDFGGAISLRAHLLHQKEYKKLLLMNVVAMAPWGSPFFAHVREHEAVFAGVPEYIHKAILEAYIHGALFQGLSDKDLSGLTTPWLTGGGQRAFYRQIAQADQKYTDEIEPLFSNIRCPVRILWGEEDKWIPIQTGWRLNQAIGQNDFHPVSAAGHLIQLEQPELVLEKMREFFI